MNQVIIPTGYHPTLDAYDTQRAITYIKQTFQEEFSSALNLKRVSAPLFVPENSGLNDNLNGYPLISLRSRPMPRLFNLWQNGSDLRCSDTISP